MSAGFINSKGTQSSSFLIGLNGPAFVAIGETRMLLRNLAGDQYLPMSVADPVQNQDAVTKVWFDATVALLAPLSRTLFTTEGIQGGGTFAADRTIKLNVNGLTAIASVDPTADYVPVYDASAGVHKKVKIQDLPATTSLIMLSFGAGSVDSTVTDRWLFPWYDDDVAKTVEYFIPVIRSGTLSGFYVNHSAPDGNGGAIVYTVCLNGVPTAITVSVNSDDIAGSDIVNTVDVIAGDLVSVIITKAVDVATSPGGVTCVLGLI